MSPAAAVTNYESGNRRERIRDGRGRTRTGISLASMALDALANGRPRRRSLQMGRTVEDAERRVWGIRRRVRPRG
jgi:hypothetical protein